ncbi:hypothetical protein ACE38V_08030 [Cytobacillus sp. Hz8]|uniref:hypothetical protein n=1 Tax=Cytobacillus sp. Hz8 TaxID=3347168 RepID=UPI0035D94978
MAEKVEKVKRLSELYDLIQYYYENRDRPVNDSGDFFQKVKECCDVLDLDFEVFKREFKL